MKKSLVSTLGALAIVGISAVAASASTFTFSSYGYTRLPATGTAGATNPYPLTMQVSGIRDVTDVNLTLHGLTHTYSADLDIYLRGPSGSTRQMMTDEGGSWNWTNDDLTFDDSAWYSSPWPGYSQSIRPDQSLAYFNGRDPNGTWSLFIRDDAYLDRGYMQGWSLTFDATEVPLPAGFPLLLAGLGAFGVLRRRKKA